MNEKPLPPGDFECCESGCSRCVWDVYLEDLQEWKQQQQQQQQQQQPKQQQSKTQTADVSQSASTNEVQQ
ncbi:MAG: oxidoreductase-like domain-containing protein [Oceanobacter sp.]